MVTPGRRLFLYNLLDSLQARTQGVIGGLKRGNLILLPLDLCLLLFESVDEDRAQTIVLDAFDLTIPVARHQQWLNLGYIFSAEPEVAALVALPFESDRLQTLNQIEAAGERMKIGLISQTRRAQGDQIVGGIPTKLDVASLTDRRHRDGAANIELCDRSGPVDADVTAFGNDQAAAGGTI